MQSEPLTSQTLPARMRSLTSMHVARSPMHSACSAKWPSALQGMHAARAHKHQTIAWNETACPQSMHAQMHSLLS